MKLALRFLFWTCLTKIDEGFHLIWDKLPNGWYDKFFYDFCQWSWGGWVDILDAIEDAYAPEEIEND
jgi:hypothetical protein